MEAMVWQKAMSAGKRLTGVTILQIVRLDGWLDNAQSSFISRGNYFLTVEIFFSGYMRCWNFVFKIHHQSHVICPWKSTPNFCYNDSTHHHSLGEKKTPTTIFFQLHGIYIYVRLSMLASVDACSMLGGSGLIPQSIYSFKFLFFIFIDHHSHHDHRYSHSSLLAKNCSLFTLKMVPT